MIFSKCVTYVNKSNIDSLAMQAVVPSILQRERALEYGLIFKKSCFGTPGDPPTNKKNKNFTYGVLGIKIE